MNKKHQQNLIDFVKLECKKYGVKFDLRRGKYINYQKGMKTSGFFDPDDKVLACARKNPNFLYILAHEYCHVVQWQENCKEWIYYDKCDAGILDDWLSGSYFHPKTVNKVARVSLRLELDNEKRTIKLLKDFGMIDKESEVYVQKSNAYVLFYLYLLETRRWYKSSNVPYENINVVMSMSKKFNMDYDKLSPKARKAFETEQI
jgi:hypothetical protein